jgi:hypothetical protein
MIFQPRVTSDELKGKSDCSFVTGGRGRIACGIKTTQTAAILAFPAAMRVAGSAHFAFLQRQTAGSVAGMALSSPLAMRAFSIRFRHCRSSNCQQEQLFLAMKAIKRASISLAYPSYRSSTSGAFFSFSLKNHQMALIFSGFSG